MPRPSRAARTLSSSRGPRPVTPTTGMPASQQASSAARVRGRDLAGGVEQRAVEVGGDQLGPPRPEVAELDDARRRRRRTP